MILLRSGALGGLLFLSGCGTPSQTQRLRLTVTVDDYGVMRTGSTVMESTCWQTNNKLGGMGVGGCHMSGEAVVVDLKQRGYLFMILCSRKDFNIEGGMGGVMGSKPEWDSQNWTVERTDIPRMIAFTNTNDPSTVVEVDPENLAVTYGEGVSLVSVKAEYTTDRITRGVIDKALPWLKSIGNNNLLGKFSSNGPTLPEKLMDYHFKTE